MRTTLHCHSRTRMSFIQARDTADVSYPFQGHTLVLTQRDGPHRGGIQGDTQGARGEF